MSVSHEFKSEGYKLKESRDRDHHREGAHLTRSPAQTKAELRRDVGKRPSSDDIN